MQENTTSPCTESLHLSDWSKSTICVVTFFVIYAWVSSDEDSYLFDSIIIDKLLDKVFTYCTVAPNIIALIEGIGCWVFNVG